MDVRLLSHQDHADMHCSNEDPKKLKSVLAERPVPSALRMRLIWTILASDVVSTITCWRDPVVKHRTNWGPVLHPPAWTCKSVTFGPLGQPTTRMYI
jgi:hypothetical protein